MQTGLNQKVDKTQAEILKKLDIFIIFWIYLINIQVARFFNNLKRYHVLLIQLLIWDR